MSLTNGESSETHYENTNSEDDDLKVLENLQKILPNIQKSFMTLTKDIGEFLNTAEQVTRISSKLRTIQEEKDELERQLKEMRKERENVEKQCQSNLDRRVYLDVGGKHFTTTIQTLTQDMNSSFFSTLIAKQQENNTNSMENRLFIDRDGELFDYILKYLRTGEINIEEKNIRKELLIEAKYYNYKKLEDELINLIKRDELLMTPVSPDNTNLFVPCSPTVLFNRSRGNPYSGLTITNSASRSSGNNSTSQTKSKLHPSSTASSWRSPIVTDNRLNIFSGSILLTLEYETKLLEFLNLQNESSNRSWKLIYRASEHGFDATDFHRCCDSYAPTISIIQTDFGNIFGGFTSIPWSSATVRITQADSTAFLFTLKNTINVPPTKYPIADEYQQYAISHNPTCGPNFGSPKNEGSDLCLRNRFNEKTNYIFFPKSYLDKNNHTGHVFAKRYFACREVEVFALE